MDHNILAAGLVGYKLNEENDKEIMNYFAVQSFKADCRNSDSQYNILTAIKNAGKRGGHKEDKRNFLEP